MANLVRYVSRVGSLRLKKDRTVIFILSILGCQLDDMRNEPQSIHGGHTCDLALETGRQHAFDPDLEAEDLGFSSRA